MFTSIKQGKQRYFSVTEEVLKIKIVRRHFKRLKILFFELKHNNLNLISYRIMNPVHLTYLFPLFFIHRLNNDYYYLL